MMGNIARAIWTSEYGQLVLRRRRLADIVAGFLSENAKERGEHWGLF